MRWAVQPRGCGRDLASGMMPSPERLIGHGQTGKRGVGAGPLVEHAIGHHGEERVADEVDQC